MKVYILQKVAANFVIVTDLLGYAAVGQRENARWKHADSHVKKENIGPQ